MSKKLDGMTPESHADYMKRKLAEAQAIAKAEGRVSAAAKKAEEAKRVASLSPELRAKEELEKRVNSQGAQVATGNILNWTNGKSRAALASRYQQAIRIKALNLTLEEATEAASVVQQLITAFSSNIKHADRLKVIRLELKQHLARLGKHEKAIKANSKKELVAIRAKSSCEVDKRLAADLIAAIEKSRNQTCGYVYLKQWTLPDGTRWLKIGITNNPNRREAEQNVLPVPAVTLRLMETPNMDQASAIERALHRQLAAQKVNGAGNRELFHLNDAQLAALMAAMDA